MAVAGRRLRESGRGEALAREAEGRIDGGCERARDQGGSPVRPTGIMCAGSIGKVKVKGGARAASGVASCLFRTPKAAKGKALTGSVSFRAGGSTFTKRFATMLG